MSITEAAASVAARAFFYPSLAWNIARNRLQETWHWWDEITETVLLGALPFYSTLEQLKELGVTAVVTLNEEFEVFITPEQYQDSGFSHLHIPTVDFLYAPPTEDLHKGADFIHEIAEGGGKTYVHCKAGRGRSTTLVLCYLTKYLGKSPEEAYIFVRERRPQVYLAQGQWTAVCTFYVSCHPDKGLCVEDFPYPTFLPILPGKQGSDGPEADQGEAGKDLARSTASGDGSTCVFESADVAISTADSLEVEPDHPSRPGEGSEASAACNGASTSTGAVRISASTQPADGDDVVILHSLGLERSDSEISLSNLATSLSTCCLDPRSAGRKDSRSSAFEGIQPPERAASPAIQIPRSRNAVQPGPSRADSSKETVNFEPSASSRGSIQLEPSGSLPGYVRIAPMNKSRSSSAASGGGHLVMQPTLSSTGFAQIDDWAAVDGSAAGKKAKSTC